jgi:hypothetical protein
MDERGSIYISLGEDYSVSTPSTFMDMRASLSWKNKTQTSSVTIYLNNKAVIWTVLRLNWSGPVLSFFASLFLFVSVRVVI